MTQITICNRRLLTTLCKLVVYSYTFLRSLFTRIRWHFENIWYHFQTLFCSFSFTNIQLVNMNIQRVSIPPTHPECKTLTHGWNPKEREKMVKGFYKFYKWIPGQGDVFAGKSKSLNHCKSNGDEFDFQLKSISLCASREAKTKTFACMSGTL